MIMKKKYHYCILITAVLFSCNNAEKQDKSPSTHEHHAAAGHGMTSTTVDYADSVNRGLIAPDTLKGSPLRMAMANIGRSHVHIEYSSPGVKNRMIWGGLVAYDQVWASGAHHATSIDFSRDVVVMGKPIKAGTYAFFTIPGKEKWTAILNTRFDQHLADQYSEQEDVARFEVTPVSLDQPVQRLTYTVQPENDTSGHIVLAWEKLKIMLPVAAPSK